MKTIRLLCAAALACASFAAAAQGDDERDTHWHASAQLGSVHDNGRTDPVVQIGFAYEFDRTWAVEALLNANMMFVRDGTDPTQPYEFDSAYGARVLATLPLSNRWNLVGGLGVVKVHEERGLTIHGYGRDRTGAMVSAAAMYRISRRWSLGVELSSFTASHTADAGLRGELHF